MLDRPEAVSGAGQGSVTLRQRPNEVVPRRPMGQWVTKTIIHPADPVAEGDEADHDQHPAIRQIAADRLAVQIIRHKTHSSTISMFIILNSWSDMPRPFSIL